MALQKNRAFVTAFGFAGCLLALPASAHISVEQAGTHMSRDGDANLKDAPCGKAGSKRGTNVYTYAPGETITISFKEFIPHPGYYRIAFDKDGDDDFKEPVSIKPVDPTRPCPFNAADKCGASDFYNNSAVLPGMDNLEPHLGNETKGTYSFEVTLPKVECDNCTLQVMQIMEDTIHGAYNPVAGDPEDKPVYIADNYHQCIDLVLKGDGSTSDDGCSLSGHARRSSSSGALLALGVLTALCRRRRRAAR